MWVKVTMMGREFSSRFATERSPGGSYNQRAFHQHQHTFKHSAAKPPGRGPTERHWAGGFGALPSFLASHRPQRVSVITTTAEEKPLSRQKTIKLPRHGFEWMEHIYLLALSSGTLDSAVQLSLQEMKNVNVQVC